ncbi:HNH endonuclease [Marinomonas sp. C2222]|uniref:HNH endonuclease n=1 Tax=Marinomonas sargassi TaxID=2984494 RepID=A0ABT2YQY0_9GAMM|nr:HNH endonuclease signature motif containing protein [Marinomonas sargassi]MCV2402287.1 HNH endonuclease [Marinomonas sargassi]
MKLIRTIKKHGGNVPISEKNRKILWGKSGNKCAICWHTLVLESNDFDSESVVGEECHIVSGAKNGPRSSSDFPSGKIDDVSNLILLCRVHHKQIDDQIGTYTAELLRAIKATHEAKVERKLKLEPQIGLSKNEIPDKLPVILTGKELFNLATSAYAFCNDYGDNFTSKELDEVAEFIQNVKDWGEIGRDLEPIEQIKAAKALDDYLKLLHDLDIFVFAAIDKQKIGGVSVFPVLHLSVQKSSDPNVSVMK